MLAKFILLTLPVVLLDAFPAPALAKKTTYRFVPLPELDGGASRALAIFGDPNSDQVMVGGESRNLAGKWRGVVWVAPDVYGSWGLEVLPPVEYANGMVTGLACPNFAESFAVGVAYDNPTDRVPIVWEQHDGGQWVGSVLPTLEGMRGEALAVQTLPNELIGSAGWSLDGMSISQAVTWEQDGMGGWNITPLPSLVPGSGAQAHSMGEFPEYAESSVSGFAYDAMDRLLPVVWELIDGVWELTELPLPMDGVEGRADSFMRGGGYCTIGSYTDDEGFRHAIIWTYEPNSQTWIYEILENLSGYVNSQANSLLGTETAAHIAVGSSDNGPGTEVATQWTMDESGIVEVMDLNDMAFGADGWTLEVGVGATTFLYDERDLIGLAGTGTRTGLGEDPHAFVLVEPRLDLYEPDPGIAGRENVIRVERCSPFETIHYIRGFINGFSGVPGCPGVRVNIANPSIAGIAIADVDGVAELTAFVPPLARGRRVLLQAVEHANCEVSNLVDYTFP